MGAAAGPANARDEFGRRGRSLLTSCRARSRIPSGSARPCCAGPLSDEVGALKAAEGADIVVTGSMILVRGLIAAGVVDEYRLFVYPVVLGRGQRLFDDATSLPRLELVQARPFRSGIVLLRYRPRLEAHRSR